MFVNTGSNEAQIYLPPIFKNRERTTNIKMKKNLLLFLAGGSVYPLLEILWRGCTHISMIFAGGICLCLIDYICNQRMDGFSLFSRCCAGGAVITCVELAAGVVVNLGLGLCVWDYSSLPLNLFGQICLPFSILWIFLTLPAMGLCRLLGSCSRLFTQQSK